MSYLLNEILLYLIAAALIGGLVGWLMRRCTCNRDLEILQTQLDEKQNEVERANQKISETTDRLAGLEVELQSKTGDLHLMTSRWKSALTQARMLPTYKAWLQQVQRKYRMERGHGKHFKALAAQNADLHAEANKKIRRLNDRVTDYEQYKLRVLEMNGIEEQKNEALAKLAQLDQEFTEKFNAQQSEYQTEIQKYQSRIEELMPLEGNLPGQDSKFNRFMDKIRLVGSSRNEVLGRTYNQIKEVKLEASEKERVFVDTCEEKDAVIEDLREQLRGAENRAQTAAAATIQESKAKVLKLEDQIQSMNVDLSMLQEHKHTISAYKQKLDQTSSHHETLIREHEHTIAAFKSKLANLATNSPEKPATEKREKKFKAPTKGLKIAAAKVKDDLQLIKGIGPKMEQKLNDFGVYSFEQLGRLKAKDITALTETLGSFPGRIKRDKWVSQSKQQHKKKYGKEIN